VLVFTDTVLNEICSDIAAHEPERGGALFGIRDTNVICHFAFDVDAKTTHATYLPSETLQEQVAAIEQRTSLVFRRIVHSHPGGMATPSGQDLVAFGKSLADNLHLASFVAPIVTNAESKRPLEQHELVLPVDSRMSTYIASRSSNGQPHVAASAVTVMPI
jgi:proteasome lid subunit RPN8/RPN11